MYELLILLYQFSEYSNCFISQNQLALAYEYKYSSLAYPYKYVYSI